MRETKELTCIGCPMGCSLTAVMEDGQVTEVTGNTCKKGAEYAHKELVDPRRIVTSTVRVIGGVQDVVSVKTVTDIPKNQIFACMQDLAKIAIPAPVVLGQIVCENVAGTEVKVAATKAVEKK